MLPGVKSRQSPIADERGGFVEERSEEETGEPVADALSAQGLRAGAQVSSSIQDIDAIAEAIKGPSILAGAVL